jgi:hypothetical protein
MRQGIHRSWTEEDLARLAELADSGASVVRAAAALNRRTNVVAKKARDLGKPLKGVRALKAHLRVTDPHRQEV